MATLASPRAKGRRLSSSAEFRRVYRKGNSKANRFLVLYSFAREDASSDAARFGVSVGRKVGKAVVRNRVKRTILEAYSQLSDELSDGLDYVVIARPDVADLVEREGTSGVRCALGELISTQPGPN